MKLDVAHTPEAHVALFTRHTLTRLLTEALRFVGFGVVIVFPIGLLVSTLLHEVAGLREEKATAAAFCVMLLVSFALARRYIFRAAGAVRPQLARFLLISLAMRSGEYLLFLLLFRLFGIGYLLAMTGAVGASSALKFILYRVWVFERPLSAREPPRL